MYYLGQVTAAFGLTYRICSVYNRKLMNLKTSVGHKYEIFIRLIQLISEKAFRYLKTLKKAFKKFLIFLTFRMLLILAIFQKTDRTVTTAIPQGIVFWTVILLFSFYTIRILIWYLLRNYMFLFHGNIRFYRPGRWNILHCFSAGCSFRRCCSRCFCLFRTCRPRHGIVDMP